MVEEVFSLTTKNKYSWCYTRYICICSFTITYHSIKFWVCWIWHIFKNFLNVYSRTTFVYDIICFRYYFLFIFLYFDCFNPKETAENLRKYGGYIPGIRPGERTAEYIDTILMRLTTVGALYLTFVCLMPEFLIAKYPIPFYLGGTSILIVVVVAMDTVTQVQTRLMSSQYESLIKKTKFGK